MKYAPIRAEIRKRIGMNSESIGDSAVTKAFETRMQAIDCADASQYALKIATDPIEFQNLCNELVVSETWFFRGDEFFETLIGHLRKLSSSRSKTNPIRVLSIACSTGEEPYSIAMAMHEGGVPSYLVRIEAVDISTKNLDVARKARYSEFSFRNTVPEQRSIFFQATEGQFELHPFIREAVHFRQGNVVDGLFLGGERPFDVILCRNVFIYLTDPARGLAMKNIQRLLAANGLLALGHAESSGLTDPPWRRFGPETACIFQRREDAPTPAVVSTATAAPAPTERSAPTADSSRRLALPLSPNGPTTERPKRARPGLPVPARPGVAAKATAWDAAVPDSPDCWNTIGVRGDRSCPELLNVGHCHNCPVFSSAGRRFLDKRSPADYVEEWTERLSEPVVELGDDLESVLIFRLRDEWLALPVRSLMEVTTPRAFHRIPHRGGLLEGLINIRGELHLTVRVDELLGLAAPGSDVSITGRSRLVVIGRADDCWAFLVDEVDRVRRFPAGELKRLPATVRRAGTKFTRGVLAWDGRTAGLLDDRLVLDSIRSRVR